MTSESKKLTCCMEVLIVSESTFAPLRSLRFVMDLGARVKDLLDGNVPQSFYVLVTAFGNSNSFACKGLLRRLYKRARNAVYRNYGPHLQGALVLAGVDSHEEMSGRSRFFSSFCGLYGRKQTPKIKGYRVPRL